MMNIENIGHRFTEIVNTPEWEELQEKYNLDYNNICVLFYRGNDKKTETKLKSYDEVIQHGKNILEKDPNIRFLIQSDEQEFIETCEATLNNYVVFKKKCKRNCDCRT